MKVVILTSSRKGTAAHHLPYLIKSQACEIAMVIVSTGAKSTGKQKYKKLFRKVLKIGVLGALNGIRMRAWFGQDVSEIVEIEDIGSICSRNNIPFHTTPYINSTSTFELFKEANADLGISLGNGYIAQKIFSIPKFGFINIHHEILPKYQNAQSIIWQIYNMSNKTGYTIHKIDKHIDTGEILYQEQVPIHFRGTLRNSVSATFAALLKASALGLVHVLNNFDDLFSSSKPQGKGDTYTTPTIVQYLKIESNFRKLRKNSSGAE